jgi:hypothetical protein
MRPRSSSGYLSIVRWLTPPFVQKLAAKADQQVRIHAVAAAASWLARRTSSFVSNRLQHRFCMVERQKVPGALYSGALRVPPLGQAANRHNNAAMALPPALPWR